MNKDSSTYDLRLFQSDYSVMTSGSAGSMEDEWGGQLSLSCQNFVLRQDALIDGIYSPAFPPYFDRKIDPELALEFAIWESASDEAVDNFEENL